MKVWISPCYFGCLLFLCVVWLLRLRLLTLCWITVVSVFLVVFLTLGGKLLIFPHWGWYLQWVFSIWLLWSWGMILPSLLYWGFLKNVYLFLRERERQRASKGGAQRERGRHRIWNRLQALRCQRRAWCGARTHEPRDHDLSQSWTFNQLSHSGAPLLRVFMKKGCFILSNSFSASIERITWFLFFLLLIQCITLIDCRYWTSCAFQV